MSRKDKRESGNEPVSDGSLALQRVYEPLEEEELPTNRLYSGRLSLVRRVEDEQDSQDSTVPPASTADPSRSRKPEVLLTGRLDEDDLPVQPTPSGMGLHTAAPRIVPTVGSKVRTGLRRSTLLVLLSVAAGGTLADGGYMLATSPWGANILNGSPTAPLASTPSQPQSSTGSNTAPAQQAPAPPAQQNGAKDDQQGTVASPPSSSSTSGYEIQRDWGIDQYKQGNYGRAIELLEGYVEVNGDDALAYDELGLSYMAIQGRDHSLEDAEMAFRTAASLQPSWAAPYQGLAESLLRRGFYTDAIAPAERATQLQPALEDAWLTLGRAYQGAGRTTDANNAFAQAAKVK